MESRGRCAELHASEELRCVYKGRRATIFMDRSTKEEAEKAPVRDGARVKNIIRAFADDGPDQLPSDQLRKEGRYHVGDQQGRKEQVYAFKSYQLRIYGAFVPGQPGCFVCSEVDFKKQNRAEQDKLKRAASKLAKFVR